MTDSAATPLPAAGAIGRTVDDLQHAIARQLANNPLLTSETGWRALAARMARHHRASLAQINPSATAGTRIQELIEACSTQAEATEALADALDHATGDPDLSLPLRAAADWLTARTLLSDSQLEQLRDLIADVPSRQAALTAQACLPALSADLPRHCTQTWPTALHLLRRNMLPSGLPPLLAFVEHLAAARERHRNALQAWADELAAHWDVTEELWACRADAVSFQLPELTPARIMFVLLPDGLQKDYYTLRMWHRYGAQATPVLRDEDTQAVSHTELARTVAQRLRQWTQETKGTTTDNLSIEFWLPLSLINEPIWEWCRDILGPARKVLIRSLDRLQIPTIQSAWRARWESLMEGASDKEAAHPVGQRTLARSILSERDPAPREPEQDPVILESPPNDGKGRSQFLAALRSGAPAILWHRQNCSPAFHNAALQLIGAGPLHELPDRISALRAEHRPSASSDDAFNDITLLWDDPHHTLPTLHDLVAPSEARSL
ncbi:hypothetical protein OG416_36740 (plasmid) [Streptomyces longwoodensis]|uniref:VMAP-C domain-containing protein n=1 Tax=Streptomyces longwoodensis TaxID=68231 RepID=UPI002F917C6C|nr:hypothetical protein OG416_36740 [Streptomyces longwoodensis]